VPETLRLQVVARETSQNLVDPLQHAKWFNQTKASPLWMQVSTITTSTSTSTTSSSSSPLIPPQPFQSDALGKRQVMRFYWGRTILGPNDSKWECGSDRSPPDSEVEEDHPSVPRAEQMQPPGSQGQASFLSYLEGGLQAALSAITTAVSTGVTIVSGSPRKAAAPQSDRAVADALQPLASAVPASPPPAAQPPSPPPSLPAKRLSSPLSPFKPVR
jgi:hypothetical protein